MQAGVLASVTLGMWANMLALQPPVLIQWGLLVWAICHPKVPEFVHGWCMQHGHAMPSHASANELQQHLLGMGLVLVFKALCNLSEAGRAAQESHPNGDLWNGISDVSQRCSELLDGLGRC